MKKLFYLIPALLLAGIIYYGCQENVNEPTPKSENMRLYALAGYPDVYQLYAGQDIDVGEIQVWNDDQYLYVKYVVDAPDWCLTETHLAVAYSLDDIPQKNGNPIPGQFPYKHEELSCVMEDTYMIPLADINPSWDCNDDLYLATHAVVKNLSCEQTGIVYGMQRNTGDVYAIDVVSGTASFEFSSVAPPTGSAKPNGLAYDGVNERMYYCTYQSSPTTLYFWDYSSVTENTAGSLGDVQIADADFYNDKYYYITGPAASDDLYEVAFNTDGTIATGYPLKIDDIANNNHGWTFNGDIAIKDDVVYGWGLCGVSGHGYEFFTYDLVTSDFTFFVTDQSKLSMQLAFGTDGVLYGHRSNASGNAYFYKVDITNGSVSNPTFINPDLAYTDCASGMICIPEEETAWGYGPSFPGKNWATYFTYTIDCNGDGNGDCQEETAWGGATSGGGSAWWYYYINDNSTQIIWAGQTINVGNVTYDGTNLVIVLTGGWELQNVSEPVKIQGYNEGELPPTRPSAGLFTTYKGSLLTILVSSYDYFAIHLDVQLCQN